MKKPALQFGFTLIEVIVVVAIFALLATLGFSSGLDFFRTYSNASEQSSLVSTLSKARARSISNMNQHQHGVRIASGQYILFQGVGPSLSWASRVSGLDQSIPINTGAGASNYDIIFSQLSGNATCTPSCTINQSGLGTTKTITINAQGAILW